MGKAYEPQGVEDAIYQAWLESGYFNPDNLPGERKETFSIVLPPPNVTGTLHMGHATMLAIEDAMVRFARLAGKKALWLPGTDHAAIATQSKVEKLIKEKENKSRHDLGREPFLDRVRAFAQESHDTIVNQCKKMGSSLDWSREAYTLDDARNKAVNIAFKRMYDDGLIYRGYRVVNWDPIGQTTVSDDEIVHKETTAMLYTFKYSKDFPIAIATTRPETKVGDTAVAVHPEDERYKQFVGKTFEGIEFAGNKLTIKVIADEGIDPDFGTGALGVTPAHSTIDADMAQRQGVPMIQVINEKAGMTAEAGSLLAGLSVKEAREKTVEWLRGQNLLMEEKEIPQALSTAERSGGVIEPLPKLQWFVAVNKEFERDGKMVTLKSLMQEAVRGKSVEILPDRFEKTYFHWIDNLRDWCISRQIWFGHRIPVWYRGEEITVGEAPAGEGWTQDEDTLDTWFSSGLWTFSTLGWPDVSAEDLKRYHPTSVLETGYDILFFWVARMILMSTHLVGDVPFKTVYLHGLVRDEQGRKMSKSLGNIIDPLTMIEKYGADATRLSLVIGSSPGNDMKLSEEKIAGFRNFTNKLWNISRFVIGGVSNVRHIESVTPKTLADKWILSRFAEVTEKVTKMHESYDLSLAGEILRDFTWGEFADWYLEIAKAEGEKEEILLFILERLLIMWHPFMPFVTEEIHKQWNSGLIMVAAWPDAKSLASYRDNDAEERFELVKSMTIGIRGFRADKKLPVKQKIEVKMFIDSSDGSFVQSVKKLICGVASCVEAVEDLEGNPSSYKVLGNAGHMTYAIWISQEGRDLEKEKVKIAKEIASVEKFVTGLRAKLENAEFTSRAPENVITQEKQKLVDADARLGTLKRELASMAQ
jgi:valyl-tRNA synthetase